MKQNRLIIALLLALLCMPATMRAVEMEWYVRANAGAGFARKTGLDMSLEIGQRVSNGLEYGVSLGFFTNDLGSNHTGLFYGNLENKAWIDDYPPYVVANSFGTRQLANSLYARAFVGYDLWRFANAGTNLHISPVFGVSYVQPSSFSSKWGVYKTIFIEELYEDFYLMGATRMDWKCTSHLELDMGLRVEVDLPRGWGVGGFYRWYCLTQKMSAAGLSVTKRF